MTMVGMNPTSLQQAAHLRFQASGKTRTKKQDDTKAIENTENTKSPKNEQSQSKEQPSLASRAWTYLGQTWKSASQAFEALLQWMSKSLSGLAQWISTPGSATITEGKAVNGKVPLPDIPTDEEVEAAMMSGEYSEFNEDLNDDHAVELAYYRDQVKKYDKKTIRTPDFFHGPQVEYIIGSAARDRISKPMILLGNLRDQRDTLLSLAQDKRTGKNIFHLAASNSTSDTAHQLFSTIKTAHGITVRPADPRSPIDINGMLHDELNTLEEVIPEGETGYLFVIGDSQLQPALNNLPEIAAQHPRIKIVVAGQEKLPPNFKDETALQVRMMRIPAPAAQDSLTQFATDSKAPGVLTKLGEAYNVDFTPEALNSVVSLLHDSLKQAPSIDQMMSTLERIAAVSLDHDTREDQSQKLTIGSEQVAEVHGALQKFLKANMAPTSSGDEASFFKTMSTGNTTFKQVIGQKKAVEELQRLSKLMKNYSVLTGLKAHTEKTDNPINLPIPKLIVFEGPSGTGKTLSARALANEAGVKFIHLGGTDLINMYLGKGADRVRELFAYAETQKPCIIFIDEIDALAAERANDSGGTKEVGNTLTTLLTELDGLEKRDGITTIVATNRNDILDSAFQNRKSVRVSFALPDAKDRTGILEIEKKLSGYKFAPDLNLGKLAEKADKFSGRQLATLIQRCASKVTGETVDVLESFRNDPNPDYAKILEAMPPITQQLLSAELDEMLKETDKQDEKGPFGFGAIMQERKAQQTAQA